MHADPADTIVALSSPHGPGARAIVRLSGEQAWSIASGYFRDIASDKPAQRLLHTGEIELTGVAAGLPADLYFWPRPRTYTGQDVAEIHTLSVPPLVDLLISLCLNAGARAAQPGEFTLRAFLAGKLDLTRAEAVLGVIEAADREELKHALAQLAGGIAQPLQQLRDDLLNLLADVEAGLDFTDEDLQFVEQKDMLVRLARALALITLLRRQIEQRAVGPRPFRAVLAGPPNAGKSSLFNALCGQDAALVSPQPGTTRDYLEASLTFDNVPILLLDTAGLRATTNDMEGKAQDLGKDQIEQADLVLLCQETSWSPAFRRTEPPEGGTPTLNVATKCDLFSAPADFLPTSAATGEGLDALRRAIAERARTRKQPALAPSLSRCRHHVDACLGHLRRAHELVLHEDPPELLAVELRGALEELGAMVGAVYTEDLLDRIFSRFCIGK